MDLTAILKILDTYGWPGVFCIVLIGVIWFIIKSQSDNAKKSLEDGFTQVSNSIVNCMTEQNKLYIETLKGSQDKILDNQTKMLDALIQKEKDHDDGMEKRMNADSKINTKLHEILIKFQADRCLILEFHNNNVNLAGLPFTWYDAHYEQISKRVPELINTIQSQPTSILSPIIDRVRTDSDQVLILTKENIKEFENENTVLYKDLVDRNIAGLIYSPIFDDSNKLIALFVMEYIEPLPIDEIKFKELAEKHASDIKNSVIFMSSLLINNRDNS